MGKKNITLVNKDANPSEYTTNDPTTITQLKSQGYVEKTDDTAAEPDGGADGAGASTGTPTGSTKATAGKAGGK